MKISRVAPAVVLTAAMLVPALGFASTLAIDSHAVTVDPAYTDFSTLVSIPRFDPAKGSLTDVMVTVDGTLLQTFRQENRSRGNSTINWTGSGAALSLTAPFAVDPAVKLVWNTPKVFSMAAYDGTNDFAGTSGVTFEQTLTASSQYDFTAPADLASFTGVGTVDFTLDASGYCSYRITGGANSVGLSTQAGATVTVSYVYDAARASPVPEPTVGAIVPAVGLLLRRRR